MCPYPQRTTMPLPKSFCIWMGRIRQPFLMISTMAGQHTLGHKWAPRKSIPRNPNLAARPCTVRVRAITLYLATMLVSRLAVAIGQLIFGLHALRRPAMFLGSQRSVYRAQARDA